MMSDQNQIESRILSLLKSDARGLLSRIRDRAPEYITIFSLKRTRDHFPAIFVSKYPSATVSDLKNCSEQVIEALDIFYQTVEDIKWYLNYTEDMPNTVDDRVHHFIKELTTHYDFLMNAIDRQMGLEVEVNSTTDLDTSEFIIGELEIEDDFAPELPIFEVSESDLSLDGLEDESEQSSDDKEVSK